MHKNHHRVMKNYRQTIQATPDQVFPLLCPVREKEWLENWQYQMLYSESGLAETGAVFATTEGTEQAIWIIVQHNQDTGRIAFVKTVPRLSITQLDIHVFVGDSPCQSYVDISYCHTGLSKQGDEIIKDISDEVFNKRLKFWEDAMNHYIETGTQLQSAH